MRNLKGPIRNLWSRIKRAACRRLWQRRLSIFGPRLRVGCQIVKGKPARGFLLFLHTHCTRDYSSLIGSFRCFFRDSEPLPKSKEIPSLGQVVGKAPTKKKKNLAEVPSAKHQPEIQVHSDPSFEVPEAQPGQQIGKKNLPMRVPHVGWLVGGTFLPEPRSHVWGPTPYTTSSHPPFAELGTARRRRRRRRTTKGKGAAPAKALRSRSTRPWS